MLPGLRKNEVLVPHHLSRFDTHPKLETANFMTSRKGRGLDLDDLMNK